MVFVLMMVFILFFSVMMVVVMVFFLHTFCQFFFMKCDSVHHLERFQMTFIHGIENTVDPFIGVAADVNEEIALLNHLYILRGRLITVCLRTRLEEHGDRCFVAYDLTDEIISGEIRTYDMKSFLFGSGLLLFRRASRKTVNSKKTCHQTSYYFFHYIPPGNINSVKTFPALFNWKA